jgi:hypothetical protein
MIGVRPQPEALVGRSTVETQADLGTRVSVGEAEIRTGGGQERLTRFPDLDHGLIAVFVPLCFDRYVPNGGQPVRSVGPLFDLFEELAGEGPNVGGTDKFDFRKAVRHAAEGWSCR